MNVRFPATAPPNTTSESTGSSSWKSAAPAASGKWISSRRTRTTSSASASRLAQAMSETHSIHMVRVSR